MKGKLWCGLCVGVTLLAASLVFAGSALAAPISVQTASAIDATHVEITFNRVVDSTATNTAHYVFSPALAVSAATLGDAGRSVTLTTAAQTNATRYTVTVSGITNVRGTQQVKFIGTYLGPNDAKTIFEDDFNRPSGLLLTDTPIAGRWTNLVISALTENVVSLRSAPNASPTVPWAGSGALYSRDTPLTGEDDNANVQARVSAGDLYYSAYLDLPRQTWPATTEVGLLRLNTSTQTAHARLYAFAQSSTAYTLMVNWKNPTGGYNATGSTVATGVTFNQWHWLQMHVKNGAAGAGEIQIFLDGKLLFQDRSIGVYTGAGKMLYAEAGIMHMSDTTSATSYTDQLRLGTAYTLPSLRNDTTAPTAVTLATSATQIHDPVTFTATGKDAVGVQRVDFLLDGAIVGSSDFAPDYHLSSGTYTGTYTASWTPLQNSGIADGSHQLTAKVYDTSGNVTTSAPIAVTTDSSGPAIVSPAASPNPFTPNGDGSQETTHVTFTHDQIASYAVQIFSGSTLVKTLESAAEVPAEDESSSWNGTYYDAGTSSNVPVPDGTYTARITVSDDYGRTTTADLPVTVNRTLKAFARTPSSINPLSSSSSLNHTTGTYSLLANANVGVTVANVNGTVVRTIQAPTTAETGDPITPVPYSFIWDGRDDAANLVLDDTYTLQVTAVNATGTISWARTVTTDTTAPTVSLDSLMPFPTWTPSTDGPLAVAITVSEAGTATVKFTLSGVTQRTISLSVSAAGQYTVAWDGTMNDLTTPAPAGSYRVKISETDKVGNVSTTVVSNPFTLAAAP